MSFPMTLPVSSRPQSQPEASLSLGLSEPEASLRLRPASLSTRPVSARGQFQPEASLGTRSALAGGQSQPGASLLDLPSSDTGVPGPMTIN